MVLVLYLFLERDSKGGFTPRILSNLKNIPANSGAATRGWKIDKWFYPKQKHNKV